MRFSRYISALTLPLIETLDIRIAHFLAYHIGDWECGSDPESSSVLVNFEPIAPALIINDYNDVLKIAPYSLSHF